MAGASAGFADFLREQLAPLGPLGLRRMFGVTGVFCEGLMFGIVSDDELYLRVDAENTDTFEEARSAPRLTYDKQGQTIDLSYWRAPERLMDEPDELVVWARAAMGAAQRVAQRRARPGPKRKA